MNVGKLRIRHLASELNKTAGFSTSWLLLCFFFFGPAVGVKVVDATESVQADASSGGENKILADQVPSREVFAARLLYHQENRGDLRLPALAAGDRRRAVPNDNRPPQIKEPEVKLPPLAAAKDGVVRRVQVAGDEKVCALTFDLCELGTVTTGFDADVLGWLQDQSIPATLFMGGKWMRTHAKRVRQVMRDPLFEIGNHAWSHGNFAIMTEQRMREEILYTQACYEQLRKESMSEAGRLGDVDVDIPPVPHFFRFPYGRTSETALRLLAEYGLRPIQWDVVAEGGGNNASIDLARRVAGQVHPGSIILFHANLVPTGTFQLVRYVVRELEQQGYRFVSIGELLLLGKPETVKDGYFVRPGDNRGLDTKFGPEGTGRLQKGTETAS